jgi:integrase/recombinase XerD
VTPLRQRMLEELRRRHDNPDTIRGYVLAVEQFATHFHKSPELMGIEEIGDFQLHLLRRRNSHSAPSRFAWARSGSSTREC